MAVGEILEKIIKPDDTSPMPNNICAKCFYWMKKEPSKYGRCSMPIQINGFVMVTGSEFRTSANFGCNKFKQREHNTNQQLNDANKIANKPDINLGI